MDGKTWLTGVSPEHVNAGIPQGKMIGEILGYECCHGCRRENHQLSSIIRIIIYDNRDMLLDLTKSHQVS